MVFCYTGDDGRRLYPGGGVHDDRSAAGQRCHPNAQPGNIYYQLFGLLHSIFVWIGGWTDVNRKSYDCY